MEFLQISKILQDNTCVAVSMEISMESLLKKFAGLEPKDLKKIPTVTLLWNLWNV